MLAGRLAMAASRVARLVRRRAAALLLALVGAWR